MFPTSRNDTFVSVTSGHSTASSTLLSRRILGYGLLFTLFVIFPGFFTAPFFLNPLMEVADVIDLISSYFVLGAGWLVFRLDDRKPPTFGETSCLIVVLILWLDGHGIHLATNSVGHLLKDLTKTPAYSLNYFYDELLGHYLWNSGVMGLSTLLIYRQWRNPTPSPSPLRLESLAAFLYGFTFFCCLVEGHTAPLAIPYSIFVVAFAFRQRTEFRRLPVLAFFAMAHALALTLTLGWGLWWKGLPEFSQIGLIP